MFLDAFRRLWFSIFDRYILYPLLSWIVPQLGITFMNLGYWPTDDEKQLIKVVENHSKIDDPDKASYYLYEKSLSFHPNYPALKGLRLLDVACGQGAGLKWIKKAHPMMREAIGLDAVPSKQAEMTVVGGNAERMPFDPNEFDIVLTVEASHLFNNCSAFFEEAYRILKPNGYLCWMDLRHAHQEHIVRQEASMTGFGEEFFEEVTEQMLNGVERTSAKYDRMLAKAPAVIKLFSTSLRATYCAPGTHTHARFVVGEKKYFAAMWKKNAIQ